MVFKISFTLTHAEETSSADNISRGLESGAEAFLVAAVPSDFIDN
jgi:hypothetical protein